MIRVPVLRAIRMATLVVVTGMLLATTGAPASGQQVPAVPDPVPVSLDPATTALLVMDIVDPGCAAQPNCSEMVPRIGSLVARARAAGVLVAYTTGPTGGSLLAAAQPAPDDPVIAGGQNKFFNTTLDDIMHAHGITTIILTGWRANGSVLFTSHGATILGYTVVVPVDGTSAAEDVQIAIGLYQVLDLLNGNRTNEPLRPGAVTLSRTDLITLE